jgi:hypothetical protein
LPTVSSSKFDGHPDRNCGNSSGASWNAIYVEHEDGSTAVYGHLKRYSLTEKRIGDAVVRGEHLGAVASSGSSSAPRFITAAGTDLRRRQQLRSSVVPLLSPHISPESVARAWRSMKIKAARTEGDAGIPERYVEENEGVRP